MESERVRGSLELSGKVDEENFAAFKTAANKATIEVKQRQLQNYFLASRLKLSLHSHAITGAPRV